MEKRLFYILILTIGYSVSSCSPSGRMAYSPQKKYAPHQLKEDLRVMEETLKNNHPSLYWYASPGEVQAAFERAAERVQDSMNEIQFRNVLNESVSVLRCGHTSIRHTRQYNRYMAGKRASGFPLGLKVLNDSTLAITSNLYRRDTVLRRGMVVTAINGLSARTIIDTLFPLVPVDGTARNFSYQNISNNFSRYYNSRFPSDSIYQIHYTDYRGVAKRVTRSYYDPTKDTLRRMPATPPTSGTTGPSVRQLKLLSARSFTTDSTGTVAVLSLQTFTHALTRSYLRATFRKLRKKQVPDLILDVRNNGGGLIQSSLLLTRLIKQQPFSFTDSIVATHKKVRSSARITRRLFTNLGMWLFSKKVREDTYRFRFFQNKQYRPHRLHYKGNVYILTGGYSFSATTMFLANVKGQPNVTLVGEETGGGWYGNNGVFIPDLVLPHTKLRMRLPLYRIINKQDLPVKGSGVLPDVEVMPTPKSIRMNTDPKMEKAVELIRQQKKGVPIQQSS